MANLIPQSARREVIRSYWLRVGAVWLFLLSAACLVVTALMVPTYLLITAQHAALADRVNAVGSKQEAYETMKSEIEEASKLAVHLDTNRDRVMLTSFMDSVDAAAGSEVEVVEYSFQIGNDKTPATIDIAGIADDRTYLASFRERLATSGLFAEVDLPLGSLAGDRDIDFTMQLTLPDNDT